MLRIVALILTCVAVTGCVRSATSSPGRQAWTVPGVLRTSYSDEPKSINPILSTTPWEATLETLVFDPLVATDPEGHDVPVLAQTVPTQENGGISKDGLTIVYHLRRGVRWQDGVPFSSRDVVFTVDAIKNPRTAVSTRHGYDLITRVDAPDDHTAIFHLSRPFSPAVDTFFAESDTPFMVLPAHLLAGYESLDRVRFNSAPVGTGPFRLVRWSRGRQIDLVANDDYYLGRPKLRRIEFHLAPSDPFTQIRTHEVDWAVVEPVHYREAQAIAGYDVHLVPFNGSDYVIFNTTRPPVDDIAVRGAVAAAIDKKVLVEKVMFGTAIPATTDIPSFMWASDSRIGTTARDLVRSRALLEAAGWVMGSDGFRHRDGKRLTLDLAFIGNYAMDRVRVNLIVPMLRDAGIAVELKSYDWGLVYATASAGGILANGHFMMLLGHWYGGVDPDDSTGLVCDQRAPMGWNQARYCNPEMDAAQAVALSHYDRATRKRAYSAIQRLLVRDAPLVYLSWPREVEVVSRDFKGFRPNAIVDTWNAWEWSI